MTIELRYMDAPKNEDDPHQYISKKITVGVFDTRDEANEAGNNALIIFENKFPLNPNYNKKERFSKNGGCFGFPKDLITNLSYLKTPFEFYAKITKLKFDNIETAILNALEATERYKKYKLTQD